MLAGIKCQTRRAGSPSSQISGVTVGTWYCTAGGLQPDEPEIGPKDTVLGSGLEKMLGAREVDQYVVYIFYTIKTREINVKAGGKLIMKVKRPDASTSVGDLRDGDLTAVQAAKRAPKEPAELSEGSTGIQKLNDNEWNALITTGYVNLQCLTYTES